VVVSCRVLSSCQGVVADDPSSSAFRVTALRKSRRAYNGTSSFGSLLPRADSSYLD
jgi:hypothetical protein